mmetsp:Transcript_59814/g.165454  ORF Transcript_59814/g.165454 Transcript_59814/m.165454 type:complete len:343 (-) Transcript_59814:205-1233(-)
MPFSCRRRRQGDEILDEHADCGVELLGGQAPPLPNRPRRRRAPQRALRAGLRVALHPALKVEHVPPALRPEGTLHHGAAGEARVLEEGVDPRLEGLPSRVRLHLPQQPLPPVGDEPRCAHVRREGRGVADPSEVVGVGAVEAQARRLLVVHAPAALGFLRPVPGALVHEDPQVLAHELFHRCGRWHRPYGDVLPRRHRGDAAAEGVLLEVFADAPHAAFEARVGLAVECLPEEPQRAPPRPLRGGGVRLHQGVRRGPQQRYHAGAIAVHRHATAGLQQLYAGVPAVDLAIASADYLFLMKSKPRKSKHRQVHVLEIGVSALELVARQLSLDRWEIVEIPDAS